eukprot:COSAG02_NODE_7237_length_3101_cov_3.440373_2_plen_275_part_00
MWQKANRFCYELSRHPAILDYVEDIIGPNFFQVCDWSETKTRAQQSSVRTRDDALTRTYLGCSGAATFSKRIHRTGPLYRGKNALAYRSLDVKTRAVRCTNVPVALARHQDAQYWPLQPQRTCTVWLAFWDSDEANGAMRVVKGSHRLGPMRHHQIPELNESGVNVLNQEADEDQIDPANIVSLNLKAGQISLHDDGLLHGSLANTDARLRCGLTMRYCPTEVKCDLGVWPTYESMIARGVDTFRHNPEGSPPTGFAVPPRMFPHTSDFAKQGL